MEQIVRVVYGLPGQRGGTGLPKLYDLIFTTLRLVGIVVAHLPVVTGGYSAFREQETIKTAAANRRRYSLESLDSLVGQDKANFAANYAEVRKAKVYGLLGRTLRVKLPGGEYYLKLGTKKDFEALRPLLMTYLPEAAK